MSNAAKQAGHDPASAWPGAASAEKIHANPSRRKPAVRTRKRTGAEHQRPAPSGRTSKGQAIINLLRRKNGASIAEMQKATGWQSHSVRGFLSGVVKKRLGPKLKSMKLENGDRRYLVSGA